MQSNKTYKVFYDWVLFITRYVQLFVFTIDPNVLTMVYFSQFIDNTQSYTTDIHHNFIIHLLHKPT